MSKTVNRWAFALPMAIAAALGGVQPGAAAAGDLLIRGRALAVIPDESATVTPLGGSVSIDNYYVPEVDFSYFVTDNIAVELIAATTKHKAAATVGPTPLGSVWLLPPTLLLQYHFVSGSTFTPYVGAGVNYTFFYNVDDPPGLDVHYKDNVGYALQAGFDTKLTEHWVLNVDVKKLWLATDVSINSGAITAKVNIDPWLIGMGVGYRFSI